ncbi:MAG: CDP-archaeol synthase [Chloroflexia bacterium]
MRGLGLRVVSGVLLLALVLVAIWQGGLLLMGLVALATALAAHEFYTMARRAGYRPAYQAGVALALLLALRAYLAGDLGAGLISSAPGAGAEALALVLALLFVLAQQGLGGLRAVAVSPGGSTSQGRSGGRGWADMGLTIAGAVYTGGLLGYAPMLAGIQERAEVAPGWVWLLLVVFGTAACDIGAYFVGSLIGRHKMIPHISPGKTWEGLAGGAVGGVVCSALMAGLLRLEVWQAIVLGLLVCAAAVLGDLCESLLKRATGIKDSSNLIPGHGGILDRLDSILFVLLAVYFFVRVSGL